MYARHLNDGMDEVDGLGQMVPSCIWGFGFVHNIDYHHWRSSLKRMLLQKINPRKHLKGKTRAKELDHDVGEQQKLLNEDGKHFPSEKGSGTKQKRSLKARIKSLIAEEVSKEGNGNQRGSSISSQPKLKRTYSIHHLEPPDHGLHEVCTDWEHPIFFFSNNKDTGAAKLWDLKKMNVIGKPDARGKNSEEVKNKNASKDKAKEHANVLEIFKVNKHLFLKSLQDTDEGLGKFSHSLPGPKAKARLTKSGSYPAANLLQKRNLEPSTMKQKQSEIWPAPKGEKLNNVSVIPKAEKFEYSMHNRSKSLPSEYSTKGSKLGQALNFILESSTESDERNIDVLVPFKESKQSDQPAETKGEDEVSNRYNSSVVENGSDKWCGESATCRVDENNSLSSHETEEHCFSRSARGHRRSSSLTESLDKYARLLGNDFGKEVKLGPSRSLRLRNEYEIGLGGNASILFGRIHSLSHLESYSSFQNGVHGDANLEDWPITTVEESSSFTDVSCQDEMKHVGNFTSTEEVVPTGAIQESIKEREILENVDNINQMANSSGPAEMDTTECDAAEEDLDAEADSLMVGKSISFRKQESSSSAIATNKFAQPCPVPAVETNFKEVPSSSVEFQESAVSSGLDDSCDQFDGDSSINCQKNFYAEPSSLPSTVQNLKILYDTKDAELGAFYKKHNTDFDYVKVILEYSGFAKDALQKTWYSSNQPLGPSIFDEMEAYWHKELECSGEDCFGCYHHQLLFDMVNEKLLNIYDRSSTYYPKALSSRCHISPFPMGDHILDEICKSISRLTSMKPEQKQSLEYIVGLDTGKDDGWMNLQLESECLSLELEDMIFDELMEELEDMIFEQVFGS